MAAGRVELTCTNSVNSVLQYVYFKKKSVNVNVTRNSFLDRLEAGLTYTFHTRINLLHICISSVTERVRYYSWLNWNELFDFSEVALG